MPTICALQFLAPEPGRVTPSDIHSVLERFLGVPETTNPWRIGGWQVIGSDILEVEVGFPAELSDRGRLVHQLANDAARAAQPNQRLPFTLGGRPVKTIPYQIGDRIAPLKLVREETWDGLLNKKGRTTWFWEFQTPTAYTSGKHVIPWYQPVEILSGLAARARRLARSEQVDLDFVLPNSLERDLVITTTRAAITIREFNSPSDHWKPSKSKEAAQGFIGSAGHRLCSRNGANIDPRILEELSFLLAFSEFSGVGARTAYGMGRVVVR